MTLREIMANPVVCIHPDESVVVAARMLTHYNIGALPVCGGNGRMCGVVTDRDIVIRCLAAGRSPSATAVREVMTSHVVTARPEMEVTQAAEVMGREQIRRLPVVENGKVCGMVSLGDLSLRKESATEAKGALTEISSHLSSRK